MFVREYGLVHNPGDAERFVRLVKWETRWLVSGDHEGLYETLHMVPIVWEWGLLDVSNRQLLSYSGPEWRMVPTAITELPRHQWGYRVWPNEAPTENEELRRMRIKALRSACHVDPVKGAEEPEWLEPVQRAAA